MIQAGGSEPVTQAGMKKFPLSIMVKGPGKSDTAIADALIIVLC